MSGSFIVGVFVALAVVGCGRTDPFMLEDLGPSDAADGTRGPAPPPSTSGSESSASTGPGPVSTGPGPVGPDFPPPTGFVQLTAGSRFACGLSDQGAVYCWGDSKFGQVGNGEYEHANPSPQPAVGLDAGIVAVGAGKFHACATRSSGTAACWGHNLFGALGNGEEHDSAVPVEVVGVSGPITHISGGAAEIHSCAAIDGVGLQCWGSNSHGQLGDGTTMDSTSPRSVVGLGAVRDFALGYIHTCAVTLDGRVSCWGWNPHGLVDAASAVGQFSTPQPKAGLVDVEQITAGNHHACARHADGRVSCWGYEGNGQLGDGSDEEHGDPLPVAGLDDAVDLAGGVTHSCAARQGGTIVCWGSNNFGQLGDGTMTYRSVPVEVVGIDDAFEVAVGNNFSCAVSHSRGALCWGTNGDGQLGAGTTEDSATPVEVDVPW